MQIAEVVALPPACCIVCRKGNQAEPKPFVDTGRFHTDGVRADRIYLCHECVQEAAGLFGYLSPEEAVKLQDAAVAMEAERDVARREAEAFRKIAQGVEELQAAKPAPKPKAKPKAEEAE